MNSNFYNYMNTGNQVSIHNQQTAMKILGNWTPDKKLIHQNNSFNISENDSTMISSNYKCVINEETGTPQKKSTNKEGYDNSIRTPIKKSKRRECTPLYSPGEDGEEDNNKYFIDNEVLYVNQQNQFYNFGNNYKLLKMNSNPVIINKNNSCTFEKLSKSKFLDKINMENSYFTNEEINNEQLKTSEILEKIRGCYLLSIIESESNYNFCKLLFMSIVEDADLFNKITNLICYSVIDGFNNRSDIFFKLLVKNNFNFDRIKLYI
jgi:hypothetical protein